MNIEKDKKIKGKLSVTLFTLMMLDFLTTFVGVGFLGLVEVNFLPKLIIGLFGFWVFFLVIILVFFIVMFLSNSSYKISIRNKKMYKIRFLILYSSICGYVVVVFLNILNIIDVLK